MSASGFLNVCNLHPWIPWGLPAPVVVIIVVVYSGWGAAPARAARLVAALAEMASAVQEVTRAALDCPLCPA